MTAIPDDWEEMTEEQANEEGLSIVQRAAASGMLPS